MEFRKQIAERGLLSFRKANAIHDKLADESKKVEDAFRKLPGKRGDEGVLRVNASNWQECQQWEKMKSKVRENREDFIRLGKIVERSSDFSACLVDLYSDKPYHSDELLGMLKECNNAVLTQSVIDGIPKNILKSSYIPGFREWQSTDGLFQSTAKFVSLEKGEVTLEKSDGKRTSIELSALRKEDQAYVKEQNTPKPTP